MAGAAVQVQDLSDFEGRVVDVRRVVSINNLVDATMTTGLSLLAALDRERPAAFEMDATDDEKKILAKYQAMQDSHAPDEVAAVLRKYIDPAERKAKEELVKLAKDDFAKIDIKEITEAFDPGMFSWEPGAPDKPQMAMQMLTEYKTLVEDLYTGDMGEAKSAAIARLKKTWGPSIVNGGNLMKYAPELYYNPVDGGYDYLRDDVEKALKEFGDVDVVKGANRVTRTNYALVATGNARAEISSGRPVSYFVIYDDEDGAQNTLMDKSGRPLALAFDYAKYAGDVRAYTAKRAAQSNKDEQDIEDWKKQQRIMMDAVNGPLQ